MDKDKKAPSAKTESSSKTKEQKAPKASTSKKKPGRPPKSSPAKSKTAVSKKASTTAAKKAPVSKAKKAVKPKTTKVKANGDKAAKPSEAKPKTNISKAKKAPAAKKTSTPAKAKATTKAVQDKKKTSPKATPSKARTKAAKTTGKTKTEDKVPVAKKKAPRTKKPVSATDKEPVSPPLTETAKAPQTEESPEMAESPKAEATAATPHQKPEQKKQSGKPATAQKPTQAKQNKPASTPKTASRKLLINAEEPEECRIALLENGKLESFYVESVSRERTKGNIYKGKIVSIETNLQAAFVDIGTGKNAFLPFSEIHPEYYSKELPSDLHWKDVNFKQRLKIGQEILLEVVKETTGNKGANMTSFLSLPGRYVVLMPGSESHGISRQIDSQEHRRKLREMLESCKLPEGVGYIIRTASKGITKTALTEDVRFLIKLWKDIRQRGQTTPAPAMIYGEQNIVTRFLRDHFSTEIQEIVVDSQEAFAQVNNFIDLLPAAQKSKTSARLHKGPRPLLNSHNIEEQIEQIYRPTVKLPSGGSIVINPTEALVAIDVNSGSTGKDKNFSETIFMANMEAAEELARQLRLRDLGGLIVVDFIDMRSSANIREVEKKVKNSMKIDKAKVDFARISKFGLMQISRQRMGSPIAARNYVTCECCKGRGIIRSVETQALAYLRQIQTGCTRKGIKQISCHLPLEVSQYLLNKKRSELSEMERRYKVAIAVEIDANLRPTEANIEFLKGQ
jgi:ribonuclease E